MTKIFLDTANLDEIKEIKNWGVLSGITTNQKIFAKEKNVDFESQSRHILDLVYPLPVSIEGPNSFDELLVAAHEYNSWGNNVIIKVPMLVNGDGIKAVSRLKSYGVKTNVTVCMTLNQVFLAKCVGSDYVSLFYNRMVDMVDKGYAMDTIRNSMKILGGSKTSLIVGSIRKPGDVEDILVCHPDVVTIPYKILKQMPFCEKTEETLVEFDDAWNKFNKKKT